MVLGSSGEIIMSYNEYKTVIFQEICVFQKSCTYTHTHIHTHTNTHTHTHYLWEDNMNTGFSFNVPSFPVSTHNNTVSATCYLIMHNYRLSFLKFILLKVNATQRSFFKKITKFFLLCTMIGLIKTHQKMKKKWGSPYYFGSSGVKQLY